MKQRNKRKERKKNIKRNKLKRVLKCMKLFNDKSHKLNYLLDIILSHLIFNSIDDDDTEEEQTTRTFQYRLATKCE